MSVKIEFPPPHTADRDWPEHGPMHSLPPGRLCPRNWSTATDANLRSSAAPAIEFLADLSHLPNLRRVVPLEIFPALQRRVSPKLLRRIHESRQNATRDYPAGQRQSGFPAHHFPAHQIS